VIVGIIANPTKPTAREATKRLASILHKHGIDTILSNETAKLLGEQGCPVCDVANRVEMILVLGGDGTMLHAVRDLGRCTAPIAGLNIGTLGFLTTARGDELEEFVMALKSKDYELVPRSLLHADIVRKDGTLKADVRALNEITLTRGNTAKIVSLEARVDGVLLNHYKADGLIVSTPTGSTAYSLSAGGPLISPSAKAFVVTPICPHSLTNRSLVLSDDSVVELSQSEDSVGPILFSADGRDVQPFEQGDLVRVRRSENSLPLVTLKNRNFYETLREKFDWSYKQ